jgi:lipoprotein-anchoring transpeptidase ErfK/SrfK
MIGLTGCSVSPSAAQKWVSGINDSVSRTSQSQETASAAAKPAASTTEAQPVASSGEAQQGQETVKPTSGPEHASLLTNEQLLAQIRKTHYMGPTDGPYPQLHKGMDLWIDVNLSQQRIYIKDGQKTIYTMLTSSGLDNIPDNTTPRGTFYTQKEKGQFFYTPNYEEGAEYWTSWKDHGVFLFHSVVTDAKGNIKVDEAEKLGKKASHGCFRLPVLDAKWIYENIPEHTKVVIHD